VIRGALHGVRQVWRDGYCYKKAGVVCLDLHPAERIRETLFHRADSPERRQLRASLDAINQRYGHGTVSFAASGTRKAWALRSDQGSAAYTTRRDELLAV
jgi:DNA polymerase V